jgi:hypothetical protein
MNLLRHDSEGPSFEDLNLAVSIEELITMLKDSTAKYAAPAIQDLSSILIGVGKNKKLMETIKIPENDPQRIGIQDNRSIEKAIEFNQSIINTHVQNLDVRLQSKVTTLLRSLLLQH